MRKFHNLLLIYGVFFFLSIIGCAGSGNNSTSTAVSGRVIQGYVANATVCLDENENRMCDPGELSTTTDENGHFSLAIPDDHSGLLCTQGGVVKSTGAPALTLLAPPNAKNITPLTTLVALDPDLQDKIEALGSSYDVDVARDKGVESSILKLSLGIEALLYNLKNQLQLNPEKQMLVLATIAKNLQKVDLEDDNETIDAIDNGTRTALGVNGTISALTSSIREIFNNIGQGTVKETDVLSKVSPTLYSSAFVVFDPTDEIVPVPNDILWTATNGTVILPTNSTDLSQNALYSAIDQLQVKGLSPNAPIAIPISTSDSLNSTTLENNVILVKTSVLAGAIYQALANMGLTPASTNLADIIAQLSNLTTTQQKNLVNSLDLENIDIDNIRVIQDNNYIKIFPTKPLDPGEQYLVILKSGIKLATGNDLISSTLFDFLKSTSPLTSEDLKSLEPLREAYSPIFTLLSAFNLTRDDILELFTFTTASKTLNLHDFGLIQAAIQQNATLENFLSASKQTIQGLSLSNATSEYYQINSAIALLKGLSQVNGTDFTSFDVTSLKNPSPTPINVPYIIYNGNLYSDSVVVFQHGLGSKKEAAYYLAQKLSNMPIIAMDLPEHGARSADPAKSGAKYLTSNIGQDRINLYQSYFDIGLFLNLLHDGKFDINGDGTKDTPTHIYFVGQSMGSITGSVATSLNSNIIDKIVLNVGGANFAAIVDQAKNALIQGLVDSLGLTKNNTQYFVTLGILQLLLDPSDPVYLAQNTIKTKTMLQNSYMDTVVPNISNQILANTLGFNQYELITPASSTPIEFNKWFMFKGDGDKNWITHGILLGVHPEYYPEAQDYLDTNNLDWAYDTVNNFIQDYLYNN